MPSRKPAKRKSAKRAKPLRAAVHKHPARVSKSSSKARILSDVRKLTVSQESDANELESTEAVMGKKLNRFTAPGMDVIDELKKRWKAQEKERSVGESEAETNEGLGIEKEEEEEEEPFQAADPEEVKDEEEEDGEGS